MRIGKSFFVFFLILFSCFLLFIFWGQYKCIQIRLSSGKPVGLWLTSQFLLNKDLDVISNKFNIDFQRKQKGYKIIFVDKNQTNVKFSNSGIYYKCLDKIAYNQINIFIERDTVKYKNIASNLYLILLKCSLIEMDRNSTSYIEIMNNFMQISSDKKIFKSLFISFGR